MSDLPDPKQREFKEHGLSEEVGAKELRKVQVRRHADRTLWVGVGTFGAVGWSIAVPTLVGIAVGLWADRNWPGRVSWTLTLLLAGMTLGCLSAWLWVSHEQQVIDEDGKGVNDE